MDKKKIFAIILFLVMSLFLFSFANPEELEFVEFEDETPVVEPVKEDSISEPVVEVAEEEPQVLRPIQNNSAVTNRGRSSGNTNTNTNTNNNNTNNNNDNDSTNTDDNNNSNEEDPVIKPAAPILSATPQRVVILLGQDYDVMTGVTLKSSENLSISSNITNLDNLNIGTHRITYSVIDSYGQRADTNRDIVILDPNADEDNDGYTNQDEYDNDFSYEDESSHPNAPTLELKGDNPLTVLKGHIYLEPGYLFTVDPSDNVTKDVTIIGEVNVNEIGSYLLTYNLVDKYGKEVEKTRVINVKEDINNNNIADDDDEKYTVKFYDFNKEKVKEESVLIGMDATAPELDDIDDYIFTGWNKDYTNVSENLDVYAVYEQDINGNGIPDTQDAIFRVQFFNIERKLVKEENVLVGMDATAPELQNVSGKIFINWDKDYTDVQKDLDVYPVYGDDINNNGILDDIDTRYTVRFYDKNQVVVKEESVLVGTSANAPTLDKIENYIFIGWDKEYTSVQEDMDIYPIYGEDTNNNGILDDVDTKYTVRFYNKANEVVKEENVLVGMDAIAPLLDEVDGYIFNGWDKNYTQVQTNLDVNPIYLEDKNHNGKNDADEEHFTIIFKTNEYGSLNRIGLERESEIKYENILTGLSFEDAGIVVPSVIENEGYYYVSWDKSIDKTVTKDETYSAVYTYQDGIRVTKRDANTNLKFQINSDESAIRDNILVYKTYKDNLKAEELTDLYETDFSTKTKGTYKLTVTDKTFTDKSLSYEIIEEKAYSTKFSIEYNTSKKYDRCSSRWDYDCEVIIQQPVNYNFLEITESYIGIVIDLNSLVVEYTDNSSDTFYSNNFGLIRWDSTTQHGNKRIPVYKTPALRDEGKTIKYVTINFTKQYKRYYIKFEYINDKFVAIEGNEND